MAYGIDQERPGTLGLSEGEVAQLPLYVVQVVLAEQVNDASV